MTSSDVGEHEDPPLSNKFESGSEGIWTFVFIDMCLFCLIFIVYTAQRVQEYPVYVASGAHLNVVIGCVNTLILVTSSMLVVRGVRAARRGDSLRVNSYLARGMGLGICFCLAKALEYYLEIESGVSVATNSFFAFYFFITFLHLLHVMVGILFLNIYRRSASVRRSESAYVTELENVGHFWHFVDLVWVVIYSLLYLL